MKKPPRKKTTWCACCWATRALLAPTMAGAKPDSVLVMMPRSTMDKVYANAKRGSR